MFSKTHNISSALILYLLTSSRAAHVELKSPVGFYTPRNYTTAQIRAEVECFSDSRLKFKIMTPFSPLGTSTYNTFELSMVSSSLIKVSIDDAQHNYWEETHKGSFNEEGYTLLGYDPIKDRITMVSTGEAFEMVHESDPSEDAGNNEDVRQPLGVYKARDGALSVTLKFKKVDRYDRVHYKISLGSEEHSFSLDSDFGMASSSLISVDVPEFELFHLHGKFPGLSTDFFYGNLGYDPVTDVVTLLLDKHRAITLRQVVKTPREGYNGPSLDWYHTEFCALSTRPGNPGMAVIFNEYTATLMARYEQKLLLIEGAHYEIQEDGSVVISIVHSSLHQALHGVDLNGLDMLNFKLTKIVNAMPHALYLEHIIGRRSEKLYRTPGCAEEMKGDTNETYRIGNWTKNETNLFSAVVWLLVI